MTKKQNERQERDTWNSMAYWLAGRKARQGSIPKQLEKEGVMEEQEGAQQHRSSSRGTHKH